MLYCTYLYIHTIPVYCALVHSFHVTMTMHVLHVHVYLPMLDVCYVYSLINTTVNIAGVQTYMTQP